MGIIIGRQTLQDKEKYVRLRSYAIILNKSNCVFFIEIIDLLRSIIFDVFKL